MLIGLYTSRVILNALGVVDYGTYNVVGGFVSMFALVSSSLTSAISRFLTFELGKNAYSEKLSHIFSSSVTIQIFLVIVVIILAETAGVWFLNNKMSIPPDRSYAANWVFQWSVFAFCINLLNVPYNSTIIAHEKMSAFAYIGIVEALFKLGIAFLIVFSPIDKLIFYAILMALVSLSMTFMYMIYAIRHFPECSFHFVIDREIIKRMFGFAGWTFLGNTAYILMTQGVSILMNVFFGVIVNAARGIAMIIDNILTQFATNFTMAMNPPIIKSYSQRNMEYMHKLVCMGSKYSFFLLYALALPILLETNAILVLWLKTVPDYTVIFVRLTLLNTLVVVVSNTLITGILATGRIRNYQLLIGSFSLFALPLIYIGYRLGFEPSFAYLVTVFIYILQLGVRVYYLRKVLSLSVCFYFKQVIYPIFLTGLISLIPSFALYKIMPNHSLWSGFSVIIISELFVLFAIYYVGISAVERKMFKTKCLYFLEKLKR